MPTANASRVLHTVSPECTDGTLADAYVKISRAGSRSEKSAAELIKRFAASVQGGKEKEEWSSVHVVLAF